MKQTSIFFFTLLLLSTSCIRFDEIFEPNFSEPKIQLDDDVRAIFIGDTLRLTAQYIDERGNIQPVKFNWTSSNEDIISIDQDGKIEGLMKGQSIIKASLGDLKSNELFISVNDSASLAIIEITSDQTKSFFLVDDQIQFSAAGLTILMEEIAGLEFKWKSSDTSVIKIDSLNGLATAVGIGEANVSARVGDISSAVFSVSVVGDLLGSFIPSPGNESYNIKGRVELAQVGDSVEVRFLSDFSVKSAPGPYVYLSNTIHSIANALEVGILPMNGNPITGPFEYSTSSGVSVNDYKYVVIYCKPFSIPFGSAELN